MEDASRLIFDGTSVCHWLVGQTISGQIIPRKSKSTKLCPLVGSGILYMDHPKNHSLFGRGRRRVYIRRCFDPLQCSEGKLSPGRRFPCGLVNYMTCRRFKGLYPRNWMEPRGCFEHGNVAFKRMNLRSDFTVFGRASLWGSWRF